MSDTPRNYGGRGLGSSSRRAPRRRGRFRLFLVLVAAVLVGYAWWITRDTHSMAALIPAGQKYWIAVDNVADKRQKIAQSDVLKSLSQNFALEGLNAALTQDIPAPQWVINNVAGQTCVLTGNDIKEFRDVLIVSRMTRIGTLLERVYSLTSAVEEDTAGGLGLRKLAGRDVYYAARGRVLVASADRNSLIQSLTLPQGLETDRGLARALTKSGSEDLQGTVAFAEDDPLGKAISAVSFALRIDAGQAKMIGRAILRPDAEQRLARLAGGAAAQTLPAPPDGLIVLSADFGKPVKDVWCGLGETFGWSALSAERWDEWRKTPSDGKPGFPQVMTAMLEQAGPGIALSWYGTDLNEMIPVPVLVGVFDADRVSLERIQDDFPPVPDGTPEWESYPHYDPKAKRLFYPLVGGPSLQPTAVQKGQTLLVSTSSAVADELAAKNAQQETLPEQGNLYMRVKPQPCVKAIADAGRLLVEIDALKGYTPETFEAEAKKWSDKAASIEEVAALLSLDNGQVLGELTLTTRLPQTGAKTVTAARAVEK